MGTDIELMYTEASGAYIMVNHSLKLYALVDIKYKTSNTIEKILGMKITQRFNSVKDFKKKYYNYK